MLPGSVVCNTAAWCLPAFTGNGVVVAYDEKLHMNVLAYVRSP